MKTLLRVLKWVGIALILLPILAIGAVLITLNIAPGQRLVEREVTGLTGGMVVLQGLGGTFPAAPRIARIEVNDPAGTWLVLQDVALDWSPFALLSRDAHIDRLSAATISVARLPQYSSSSKSSGGPFSLPVRVDVDQLAVSRVELAREIAGTAALVAIEGQAHLASLEQGSAELTMRQLDGAGTYHVTGQLDADKISAHLTADEPTHGLLAQLSGVPDLGALSVNAALDGPRDATSLKLAVSAGPLRADAAGTIDLVDASAQLDVTAKAPEMHPSADIGWTAVALDAHVHGPATRPDVDGTLRIDGLTAAGTAIGQLSAKISGNAGQAELDASATGLRIPGPKPDLLAAAPLRLAAQIQLDTPDRMLHFSIDHPLLSAKGDAVTSGSLGGTVALTIPTLTPLAAIGGVDLQGSATFAAKASIADGVTQAQLDGKLHITGGMSPVPAVLGDATLGLNARFHGSDITLSQLTLAGRALTLNATGGMTGGRVQTAGTVSLADLAALAPTVAGPLTVTFQAAGPTNDLSAQAEATGDVTIAGHRGPIKVTLTASGLPGAPSGHVVAEGMLDGSPLSADIDVQRDAAGTLTAKITRTEWKSAHLEGDLHLAAGATLPQGRLSMHMARLADLRPLIGQDIAGALTLDADLAENLRLQANATDLALPGTAAIASARLSAEVREPTTHPSVDATLRVEGVRAAEISGNAQITVRGPQEALALRVESALQNVAGADASLNSTATVNAVRRQVALATLQATWKGLNARLLSPARLDFADGMHIDRLRLGLNDATVEVSGRASPTLDLTASVRQVTPDLARLFVPDLQADGLVQVDARLTGTPAQPTGTIKLVATGLRMRNGPGRSLPPAGVTANADLRGATAQIDVRLVAGSNRLSMTGQVPLTASGAINVHGTGGIDLTLLDPILSAQGRRLRGQMALDVTATGRVTAPSLGGTVKLTQGDFQDFTQGVHLAAIQATIEAVGDQVRIVQFSARAGAGSITATGTAGVLAPGIPVDLTITARNAKPLASDLLSAVLDADLTVRGQVQGHLAAGGSVHIRSANIQVPENLPTSIAVLNLRVPGQKPPPPPAPGPDVALNLDLDAPEGIFVRGRGLDAELGGKMHVGGTAADPRPTGGFQMRRGTFSLAGVTLTFASGEVTFNGASKIDPTLNFVANSSTASTTATLTIGGYASAPKITLSSVPDLPQDEVLAYLLFRTSASSLSPLQLAEIAGALAQISGVTGGGIDPLAKARAALGLDQLNVGSNSNGSPTLEAGRYVAKGVYVGAKQGVGGNAGTQATVQIDITKGLKLETDAGSGAGSNSVGLTYQFEY